MFGAKSHFLERIERARGLVDVLLIDFVRDQYEVVLTAELYNIL